MAKNLETNNELTEGGDGDDCVVLCAVLAGVQQLLKDILINKG